MRQLIMLALLNIVSPINLMRSPYSPLLSPGGNDSLELKHSTPVPPRTRLQPGTQTFVASVQQVALPIHASFGSVELEDTVQELRSLFKPYMNALVLVPLSMLFIQILAAVVLWQTQVWSAKALVLVLALGNILCACLNVLLQFFLLRLSEAQLVMLCQKNGKIAMFSGAGFVEIVPWVPRRSPMLLAFVSGLSGVLALPISVMAVVANSLLVREFKIACVLHSGSSSPKKTRTV